MKEEGELVTSGMHAKRRKVEGGATRVDVEEGWTTTTANEEAPDPTMAAEIKGF